MVRAWRERVAIPTYGIGEPDRNPMFLEKRVYQGSSGAVYPHAVVDRIESEKRDAHWDAVYLENEHLRIMVLPELGGRVQMAQDVSSGVHFVYHNRVIKPALVGLAGPWISGGIEFNWPQHHRPNTYGPVDCEIEHHDDGSVTVWCHEIDRMRGTRGTHGLRLRPGRAVLEVHVRLHNRTRAPQTFLWWANPAFPAGDGHQSMFPPDVHAVMDHGKRDVSTFPIATGEYYKVDYSPGTDISRYRNIPVPTSYMAYHSDHDFVGTYDWSTGVGLLHVANRHVSPGKKQWTWGHGEFGRAWDRHLTDEDGPYIELMCGVYTDNQPDFSWLEPGEQKSFVQHFMPYKGVGRILEATVDACVGLEIENGIATARVYATTVRRGATIEILHPAGEGDRPLVSKTMDLTPVTHAEVSVKTHADRGELVVLVRDASGRELVRSRVAPPVVPAPPEPARAIGPPASLDSCESLYLAAVHLMQYRHATRDPEPYLREALTRDPGDTRCNIALGRLLMTRGRPELAEGHFRAAIERLTRHNPNPPTGAAHLGLGLALLAQGRTRDAEVPLWKATWNDAEQPQAFFELARLACRGDRWPEALDLLDRCLARNADHHQAAHLRVEALFHLGRDDEALRSARSELRRDPFAFGVLWSLCERGLEEWSTLDDRMRDDRNGAIELALDFAHAGRDATAARVLTRHLERTGGAGDGGAMVRYHLADVLRRSAGAREASEQHRLAAAMPRERCFPNKAEDITALTFATFANPQDALAPYALGNLWYDRRQHDRAIEYWQLAVERDPSFATAHRNLGLAAFNTRGDGADAWSSYCRAFELDETDARVLFELDQLAARLRHDPVERLERLEAHRGVVAQRDDLTLQIISLLNRLGRHAEARDALLARRFSPWEGGEGKVPAQFLFAVTRMAREALAEGRAADALALLDSTDPWPDSLGEGRLANHPGQEVDYLRGLALRELGQRALADEMLERATLGAAEPSSPMFYNDQPPEAVFYQGLALLALDRPSEASLRFDRLLAHGAEHVADRPQVDFFAVSLPDFLVFEPDLASNNEVQCRMMMALGLLGLGRSSEAAGELHRVIELDPAHALAADLLASQGREEIVSGAPVIVARRSVGTASKG